MTFDNIIMSATITQRKNVDKLGKDIAYLETDIQSLENKIKAQIDPLSPGFWDNLIYDLEKDLCHPGEYSSCLAKARFIRKLL